MVIKALMAGGAVFAALSSASVSAQTDNNNYAAAAITSGLLDQAERELKASSNTDAVDPARLINIATVYARTQRFGEARAALSRVQSLPAEQLELSNGRVYSSHVIATAMLERLGN